MGWKDGFHVIGGQTRDCVGEKARPFFFNGTDAGTEFSYRPGKSQWQEVLAGMTVEKKDIHGVKIIKKALFEGFGQYFKTDEKLFIFGFFFVMFLVAAFEFINAAGGVNQFDFSGKERVRGMRNLEFYQGIFFTVFPNDGVFCGDR